MNLNDDVLFNYSWLYHKCRACCFDELTQDFTLSDSEDAKLVEQALLAARPYIGPEAENLAPEIAGRLLPFIGASPAIRRLVTDCDRSGVQRCALVPNFPYRQTSGGALQGTVAVDGRPTSSAIVGQDRRLLLIKDLTSSSIQVVCFCTMFFFYRAMLCIMRTVPSQDVRLSVCLLSVTCRYSVKTVITYPRTFFTVR